MDKEINICEVCSCAFQTKSKHTGNQKYCTKSCANKASAAVRKLKVADKATEIQTYYYSLKSTHQKLQYLSEMAEFASQGRLSNNVRMALTNPYGHHKQLKLVYQLETEPMLKSITDIFYAYCRNYLNTSPMELFKAGTANREAGAEMVDMPVLSNPEAKDVSDISRFGDDDYVSPPKEEFPDDPEWLEHLEKIKIYKLKILKIDKPIAQNKYLHMPEFTS